MQKTYYTVYWARLAEHSDPFKQGYIGITKDFDERQRSHLKAARNVTTTNNHFHNALLKYDGKIIWDVLSKNLNKAKALKLESLYRPNINIAWNTDKGGVIAVSPEWYIDKANKEKHRQATSEATKKRIAEKDTPKARAERQRKTWANEDYRKAREGVSAGKNNPQHGKFGKDHPSFGHKKTKDGLKAISEAHKGKVLSAETRKKISDARYAASGVSLENRADMYRRRCAGEFPSHIAKDYPKIKAIDLIIRRWWQRNGLPKPSPLGEFNNKYVYSDKVRRETYQGENSRASKFTLKERIDICKRRADGESYKSIGETYEKGVSTIRQVCKVWGPKNSYPFQKIVADKGSQKFTNEQKVDMCKRRANGEKFVSIAKDYSDATESNVNFVCSVWGPRNGYQFTKKKTI